MILPFPFGVADLAQRAVAWCAMCGRRRGGVGGGRISRSVSSNGRAPPAGRVVFLRGLEKGNRSRDVSGSPVKDERDGWKLLAPEKRPPPGRRRDCQTTRFGRKVVARR